MELAPDDFNPGTNSGSPELVVMGGDSSSEGDGFKSQHRI